MTLVPSSIIRPSSVRQNLIQRCPALPLAKSTKAGMLVAVPQSLTPPLEGLVTASDTSVPMKCLPWLAFLLVIAMAWSIATAEDLQDSVLVREQASTSLGLQNDQLLASSASSLASESLHEAGTAREQQLPSNSGQEALTDQVENRLKSSLLYVAYRLSLTPYF